MTTTLYQGYLHKSQTFLFPLLKVGGRQSPQPEMTFIRWEGIAKPEDRMLIAVYAAEDKSFYPFFRNLFIHRHPMLKWVTRFEEFDYDVFVFDFNRLFTEDFDHFLAAKYSRFSIEAFERLGNWYGPFSPMWAHMHCYLRPESYFGDYADLLDVDEQLLREVGELCDPYDPERELFRPKAPLHELRPPPAAAVAVNRS